MPNWNIIWDLDDDPAENVWHLDEHGVTKDEVAEVMRDPLAIDVSRSSGRPIAFGFTSGGRSLAVVYEQIEDGIVYPVTAYDVEL